MLALKGQSPPGQDQDDVVSMSFTTVQKKVMGIYWLDDIFCSAVSPGAIAAAEDEITALLRERHHVLADKEDDFSLHHPVELAKASVASQRTMTLLLASIASVALPVGGVRSHFSEKVRNSEGDSGIGRHGPDGPRRGCRYGRVDGRSFALRIRVGPDRRRSDA